MPRRNQSPPLVALSRLILYQVTRFLRLPNVSYLLLSFPPTKPTTTVGGRGEQREHIPPEMPMATATAAPTTAPAASLSRRHLSLSSPTPPPPAVSARPFIQATRLPEPKRMVSCQVTVTSDVPSSTLSDEEAEAVSKAGARIRVTVPLKVYHVPKNPEVELCGMEGTIKQYVGVWKGNRISANLPFKVEFLFSAEGQANPVKFLAHLKEDEFEYLPSD